MKMFDQRITDLEKRLDKDQDHTTALKVISILRKSLEDACKNEYSKPELHNIIFSKNDCLATPGAGGLPKEMRGEIKNLQEEIVDTYGLQD